MPDTVICAPVRTAVGRYGGVFKDMPAASLGAAVISAVVERTGVDPGLIDDVIFGQCYPNGEAPALGRVAALDAGLPVEVPGVQVDRRCGSGLQAVINEAFAAQVLACTREWKFAPSDFDRLNANGSGISLGHPIGATGGRILATLLHKLVRREQRYGLETMCIGCGQGLAALFERVA